MTPFFSESEVIARVSRLTEGRLVEYCAAHIVIPAQTETGPMYQEIDIARLELACDLHDQYEAEPETIGLMISLIDQLHGLRAEMRGLVQALNAQPDEVRRDIANRLISHRFGD
ncbi:hypothetical protein OEZ49_14325 [Ruegeria sp. WL0004]|uniref:Chaperone modulatory protein CbpM n=1 Tax=Ruegeria marisflavi TaxID=2984152 RepID=A0ABT2WSS3_9RHOB|nr:hypothetical protein [Ruegeria sp. WL0004]MCU9838950.1 hypothetical protein [Ruegeria sp. WL0004]